MLSTVTYALSKKYTDKAVEAAADVAVDKAVDAAKEAVSQDMSEFSGRLDSVEEGVKRNSNAIDRKQWYVDAHFGYLDNRIGGLRGLNQYTDEEKSASLTSSGQKYIYIHGEGIKKVPDENYQCKKYNNLGFSMLDEWVFDAYCTDVNVPIAILVPRRKGSLDWENCGPLYATKVGPIDKSIILSRGASGPFDTNICTIILNSYQSEPRLYKHKFDKINVYTKDETDAAIANAITNVINTAY